MGKALTQEEKDAKALAKAQEKEAKEKEKQEKEEAEAKALAIRAETAIAAARQYAQIIDEIVESGGECDDATLEVKLAWEGQLESKAEGIGFANLRLNNKRELLKAIIAGYEKELRAVDRAEASLKRYFKTCMEIAGITSIKKTDGQFSVSLVEGRIKTVIDNPNALPFDCVDIVEVIKPKTDKIKAALEAGQDISGAHLERGENFVMIRSK